MGPLIFIARTHQIKRKKSQLNLRLMKIQNQREKLAEQISAAQQCKTQRSNMRNLSNSIWKEQLNSDFANKLLSLESIDTGNDQAMTKARNIELRNLQMEYSNQMTNYSIRNAINSLNDDSDTADLDALNAIDSQLEQEQTGIESQLKLLQAEEQAVEKQMDQEIKNSAPKFGLSG